MQLRTAKTNGWLTEVRLHGGWGSPVSLAVLSGKAPQQSNRRCILSRRPSASYHPVWNSAFCWAGPMARHAQATTNCTTNRRNSTKIYWTLGQGR